MSTQLRWLLIILLLCLPGEALMAEIEEEIVSDAEYALLEQALSLAEAAPKKNADCAVPDIEDSAMSLRSNPSQQEISAGVDMTEEGSRATPLELHRSWGRSAVYVTELCSQEWCEQQLDLTIRLKRGRQEETRAMAAGKERHLEAELEVHVVVPVETHTREDVFGLKLLNLRTAAHQLCTEGLAREIPVFGSVHGLWLTGVIDELKVEESGRLKLRVCSISRLLFHLSSS